MRDVRLFLPIDTARIRAAYAAGGIESLYFPECPLASMSVDGDPVQLHLARFVPDGNADRLALVLAQDAELYGRLSVNLPGIAAGPMDLFMRSWELSDQMAEALLATGLFEDTGTSVPTGHVRARRWRFWVP